MVNCISYSQILELRIQHPLVIGIENAPMSASRRAHPLSPAVVSPSPYALHLNAESIWRWGGVRQGGPAVVDPERELLSDAFRWARLRADYQVVKSAK